jgi:di/tricarboxylate transporter
MAVGKVNFERIYNSPEIVVLQDHDDLAQSSAKGPLAIGIMVLVIATAAIGLVPILVSSLAGCVAMLVTGCLDLQKAYRRVDWSVIFLLAGVIPLGIAMDNTGASGLIANTFIDFFGTVSPRMLIGVLFITTTLFSGVISNNATAILLAPIAVSIASGLSVDPRPLLLTVMFAANLSFISPIGYQTNMLIYRPGEYRFIDFIRTGGLLTLILWAVATLVIPMIYF